MLVLAAGQRIHSESDIASNTSSTNRRTNGDRTGRVQTQSLHICERNNTYMVTGECVSIDSVCRATLAYAYLNKQDSANAAE